MRGGGQWGHEEGETEGLGQPEEHPSFLDLLTLHTTGHKDRDRGAHEPSVHGEVLTVHAAFAGISGASGRPCHPCG